MTSQSIDWGGLVLETIQDPADAAAKIKSWHLPRSVLYQALFAMVALNTLFYGIAHYMNPTQGGAAMQLDKPFVSFAIGFGGVLILIHLFFWAGRAVGGTGTLGDFLALFIWFQAISVLGLALTLVGVLIHPAFGAMINLSVLIFSIWLFVHFLKSGLGLETLWHAAGLMIAVPTGVILGLSLLIGLIGGVANVGLPSNV